MHTYQKGYTEKKKHALFKHHTNTISVEQWFGMFMHQLNVVSIPHLFRTFEDWESSHIFQCELLFSFFCVEVLFLCILFFEECTHNAQKCNTNRSQIHIINKWTSEKKTKKLVVFKFPFWYCRSLFWAIRIRMQNAMLIGKTMHWYWYRSQRYGIRLLSAGAVGWHQAAETNTQTLIRMHKKTTLFTLNEQAIEWNIRTDIVTLAFLAFWTGWCSNAFYDIHNVWCQCIRNPSVCSCCFKRLVFLIDSLSPFRNAFTLPLFIEMLSFS